MLVPLQFFRRNSRHDSHQLRLMKGLFGELFQTETSATKHCIREAERLTGTPPSAVLRAVGEHARDALQELPRLARAHSMPVSRLGRSLGWLFSFARHLIGDRLLQEQMSYRSTLLGLRHGIDLVQLLMHTSLVNGDDDLAAWCETWLGVREPLVRLATDELSWFAENPRRAMARPPQLLHEIRQH